MVQIVSLTITKRDRLVLAKIGIQACCRQWAYDLILDPLKDFRVILPLNRDLLQRSARIVPI